MIVDPPVRVVYKTAARGRPLLIKRPERKGNFALEFHRIRRFHARTRVPELVSWRTRNLQSLCRRYQHQSSPEEERARALVRYELLDEFDIPVRGQLTAQLQSLQNS